MVYLFDFDGTLVDSMPKYADMMKRILDENGVKYPNDVIKTITPLGFVGTAKYFREQLGLDIPIEQMMTQMGEYALYEYKYNVPAKADVIPTLQELARRGDRLNVLTASPHITLDACLKRLGIYELFENVWSCEDFGTTKSDPKIYKMVAERLSVAPQDIIFLDDNIDADRSAKSAGLTVFGVYDDTSKEYVEQMKAETDKYIYSFSELL